MMKKQQTIFNILLAIIVFTITLSVIVRLSIAEYSFIQFINEYLCIYSKFIFQGFILFLYLSIYYIYYVYNHQKFSFLAFLISIFIKILVIFVITSAIYMTNNQNYITINDDKSLQYICAILSIIIITLAYVKKVQKDGLKKTLLNCFLLISSFYLLRLNLLFFMPLVLPLTVSQLVITILTTRLNLITYIIEDIFNSQIWYSIKLVLFNIFSASHKIFITWISTFPVFHLDETGKSGITTSDWGTREKEGLLPLPPIRTFSGSHIIEAFKGLSHNDKQRIKEEVKFNEVEMKILHFILQIRDFSEYVVFVCPNGKEIYPVSFSSIFFDLSDGKPNIVPFPFSKDYLIPLYKLNKADTSLTPISDPHHIILKHTYHNNGSPESNFDWYSKQRYFQPIFINDWDQNEKICVKYTPKGNNRYPPFDTKLGRSMKGEKGQFFIKINQNRYIGLGVELPNQPCKVFNVAYNKFQCLNHKYYLSSKESNMTHLEIKKALYMNDKEEQKNIKEEIMRLNSWNGKNRPELQDSLSQDYKTSNSPPLTSKDIETILSWKKSS